MPDLKQNPLFQEAQRLHQAGAWMAAETCYRQLLEVSPQHPEVLSQLGAIALQSGKVEQGVTLLGQSLALEPNQPQAMLNLGVGLRQCGRLELALATYDCLLALQPDYAEVHYSRGNVLQDLRRFDEALASAEQAIRLKPTHVEAHYNRGNALLELERWQGAIASYEQAIGLNPGFVCAWNNRGTALQILQRLDEARQSYARAIFLQPDFVPALLNQAFLKLLMGEYAEGWQLFEWRRESQPEHGLRSFSQPRLTPDSAIAGKTILIHPEQGLGDFIQFCRYVPRLAAKGASVLLEVPKPLQSVIATLQGNFTLVERGQSLPEVDFHCPVMSLPQVFQTTLATIPLDHPYLFADAYKAQHWRARLGGDLRPRVGLVWSGGHRPDQPELWTVNARRNIKLALFAAFRKLDVSFYSLQKGLPAAAELRELELAAWDGPVITDFTAELLDFSDTAALIANLDLVIAVDTSTAHLAAAMGKPVWLLNRFDTCWRWLTERQDSPWYPSVSLFRQPALGDWESVLAEVAERLARFVPVR